MELKEIIRGYVEKEKHNKDERGKIQARIEQREKQIERLKTRLNKIGYCSWIDELLMPIAKTMVEKMPDRSFDILGPFGMTSETAIHFYKLGVAKNKQLEGDNCRSITFRPKDLDKGELVLVDYTQNTGQYAKGTLGEMNGMNYPTIPLKNTIGELLKFMNKKEKTKVA